MVSTIEYKYFYALHKNLPKNKGTNIKKTQYRFLKNIKVDDNVFLLSWSSRVLKLGFCWSSPLEVFCRKAVLRNFAKFTDLRPATLLKKSLWYRCFPVNFAKFLRTPFFKEHHRWLLLFWNRAGSSGRLLS